MHLMQTPDLNIIHRESGIQRAAIQHGLICILPNAHFANAIAILQISTNRIFEG